MWANAHETGDSISLISYAGCRGLSPVISAKIYSQSEIAKNWNPYLWGLRSFKVIGVGTAGKLVSSACYDMQQLCVYLSPTVILLDWSTLAEIARFEGCRQIWRTRTQDSLKLGGRNLPCWNLRLCWKFRVLQWFRRSSLLKCVWQPKIAKNSLKPQSLGFKVIRGHPC